MSNLDSLPGEWQIAKIGDLVDMKSGFACAKTNLVSVGIAHLRPFNIGRAGELDLNEIYHIPTDFLADFSDYALTPGDVLFNNTNSVELVGKSGIVRESLNCGFSNHLTRLRVKDNARLDPLWLLMTLRQLWTAGEFAARCNRWIGQAGINTTMLAETTIPVPPLAEQRRIVAYIEAAFARIVEARRLLERIAQETESLLGAALAEAFDLGDPLPAGWDWKSVIDIGDKKREPVQTGPFGAQLKSSEFVNSGVPVIAIGNVKWGYLNTSGLNYVTPQKAQALARYRIRSGDILFTRMGTVGRSCVVPPEADNWLISYHLLRIAVQQDICDSRYLTYCFRGSRSIGEQIENVSRGATRAGVNTTILKNLRFPLPPLAEQRRIVAYLDSVQAQVEALRGAQAVAAAEIVGLEASILARAFRGEL